MLEGESMAPVKAELLTEDARIYYEKYGAGTPLILLHGNGGSGRYFSKQIPVLAKFFRLFVIDSRGQGRSTNKADKLTFQLMAEDINSLMVKENLAKADILGFSDGANTAMVFAVSHPEKVRRLILNAGNTTLSGVKKSGLLISDALPKFCHFLSRFIPALKNLSQVLSLLSLETILTPAELKKITAPALVLAGEHDIIKTRHSAFIAETIPQARLVILEGLGHRGAKQNPQRFNEEVLKFLTRKEFGK